MDDNIRDLFNQLTLNTSKECTKEINQSNAYQIIEHLPTLVSDFNSDNLELVYKSTIIFRKLLSIETSPPIDIIINTGIVPRLIQLLSSQGLPLLQFEAAWTLTNIASGTQENTNVVIENGGDKAFISLLNSTNDDDVKEQAVLALGNIAGSSVACRDLLLNQNALLPVLNVTQNLKSDKLSILRYTTWTISNLCRGKPPPPFELVKPAIPVLAQLLCCTDEEVLTDACWALSCISDGPDERTQLIINSGVCRRLIELLSNPSNAILTPVLRTVGNLVTGDDTQTQVLLNLQLLPHLSILLKSPKKNIRREACWIISNITAGNNNQIQQVIEANLFSSLISLLSHGEVDIKKEATYAIVNTLTFGKPEQVKYAIQQGCIKPLCDLLEETDRFGIAGFALDGIIAILKTGELEPNITGNPYAILIEDAGGLDNIESLQSHPDEEVFQKAFGVLEKYFGAE